MFKSLRSRQAKKAADKKARKEQRRLDKASSTPRTLSSDSGMSGCSTKATSIDDRPLMVTLKLPDKKKKIAMRSNDPSVHVINELLKKEEQHKLLIAEKEVEIASLKKTLKELKESHSKELYEKENQRFDAMKELSETRKELTETILSTEKQLHQTQKELTSTKETLCTVSSVLIQTQHSLFELEEKNKKWIIERLFI